MHDASAPLPPQSPVEDVVQAPVLVWVGGVGQEHHRGSGCAVEAKVLLQCALREGVGCFRAVLVVVVIVVVVLAFSPVQQGSLYKQIKKSTCTHTSTLALLVPRRRHEAVERQTNQAPTDNRSTISRRRRSCLWVGSRQPAVKNEKTRHKHISTTYCNTLIS